MKRIIMAIAAAALTFSTAYATTEWSPAFVITNMAFYQPGNYQVRVLGLTSTFNCVNDFAYVEESFPGGKTTIAALMAAYLSGKSVEVGVTRSTSSYQGKYWCAIDAVYVHN